MLASGQIAEVDARPVNGHPRVCDALRRVPKRHYSRNHIRV